MSLYYREQAREKLQQLSGAGHGGKRGLKDFIERTKVDELMITAAIYEHTARLHSYELVAQMRDVK